MVKIINFLKQMCADYAQAQKELRQMGFHVVPAGYMHIVVYLDPDHISKNIDQTDFENRTQ
jgi:hypothetical protein